MMMMMKKTEENQTENDDNSSSLFDDIKEEINHFSPSAKYEKYDNQLDSTNNNNLTFIHVVEDTPLPIGAPENCQEFFFLVSFLSFFSSFYLFLFIFIYFYLFFIYLFIFYLLF